MQRLERVLADAVPEVPPVTDPVELQALRQHVERGLAATDGTSWDELDSTVCEKYGLRRE